VKALLQHVWARMLGCQGEGAAQGLKAQTLHQKQNVTVQAS